MVVDRDGDGLSKAIYVRTEGFGDVSIYLIFFDAGDGGVEAQEDGFDGRIV